MASPSGATGRLAEQEGTDERNEQHRGDGEDAPSGPCGAAAAEPGVGGDAGEGEREDCGCQVGDSQPASSRVLDSHRQSQQSDQRIAAARTELLAADRRDRDGDRAENQLNRRRRKELASPVGPQAGGEPAGCDPARQEAGKREQRPPDRQTAGASG